MYRLDNRKKIMKYLSIGRETEKWGLSVRRVNVLCSEERINGATKIGPYGTAPATAENRRMKGSKVKNIKNTQGGKNRGL